MKRGQVTLLIIVGIILVAITALIITYKEQLSEELQKAGLIKKEALDTAAEKITQEINSCLEEITGDAILYTASNNEGLPELNEIEKGISDYIAEMIPFCVIGRDFGAKAEPAGDAKASIEITDDKITARAEFPVRVTLEGNSLTVTDFSAENDARLRLIYNIATEIAQTHEVRPGVCFSCLSKIGLENNLNIDVYNPEGATEISFVISDQEKLINNKPLIFTFSLNSGETA